jgi:hypothetical protein
MNTCSANGAAERFEARAAKKMKVADRHTKPNFRKNTPFFYHIGREQQRELCHDLY